MVGEDASKLRSMLQISMPMDNGIVTNWPNMRHVWDHTFYDKLKIDPKETKVGLGLPPGRPGQVASGP